jgi:Kelch motif.
MCINIKKRKQNIKLSQASVGYLNTKHSYVTKLSENLSIERTPINLSEPLAKESSYTYVHPDTFFIIGGYNENSLSNEVLKLSLSTNSIEYLPSLPINSK